MLWKKFYMGVHIGVGSLEHIQDRVLYSLTQTKQGHIKYGLTNNNM